MNNHFDIKKAQRLDGEGRIKELRPGELLANVGGLAAAMTAVDLGAGTGTFALPMAAIVGDSGVVYAVDDSEAMLGYLRAKNPPANLKPLQRDVAATGLPDGAADFCLMAFILHEVKLPDGVITEAFRILKPESRALVVDWKAELESPGPPRAIRLTRERTEGLLRQAGFSQIRYVDWTANHYAVLGYRPAMVA